VTARRCSGAIRSATNFASALSLIALGFFAGPSYGQISEEVLKRQISDYANDVCSLCHDLRVGEESAPRIAGQQRAYIEAQINAFRRQSRAEPEASDCMWGLSSALSDGLVAALAGYFATQPPRPGIPGDPVQIQLGLELFNRDDGKNGIPSCAQCHGQRATGVDAVPRLAGQLSPYLIRQMRVVRLKFRDSPVMHGMVKDLSDEQLRSLAAYLQSL